MRILLIAYDFPPIPSPQSLRWTYLVRELNRLGHEVGVLAPDVPGYGAGGLPDIPTEVVVHRVYPGRLSRLLAGRSKERPVQSETAGQAIVVSANCVEIGGGGIGQEINWKKRTLDRIEKGIDYTAGWALKLVLSKLSGGDVRSYQLNWRALAAEVAKAVASKLIFPDFRSEWIPHARKVLKRIAVEQAPDIVILSHEPACSLLLASTVSELGLPWVADFGDPVLAPYTTERWRHRAERLERDICLGAGFVSVTSMGCAETLAKRHGQTKEKFILLTQGHDPDFVAETLDRMVDFDIDRLELLYTGSFYEFRRAEVLLAAVCNTKNVRLTVATISAPDYLRAIAAQYPDQIRLVGFLPHKAALAAQRECDVLLNIANVDPVQVPGKVYEYLGAGRPIVHLRGDTPDVTSRMIEELGVGWELGHDEAALTGLLGKLYAMKLSGGGHLQGKAKDHPGIAAHSWRKIAVDWQFAADSLLREMSTGISIAVSSERLNRVVGDAL